MNAKQFALSTCRPGEQREAQPASNVVFAVGGRKTKDPCVRDELTMHCFLQTELMVQKFLVSSE